MKISTVYLCCNQQVRVRFAPSPTGFLHVGGLRTLFINYLFAKSHQDGKLILRIEDTDQTRLVPNAAEKLISTIRWLRLEFDEGPHLPSTPSTAKFGPYVQSQRLPLYKKHAELLVEKGHAYRCFCSMDRMFMLRKEALKNHLPVTYDGRCRHITQNQIEEYLSNGTPYTVRLKMERNKLYRFEDMVFGDDKEKTYLEGDPILLKSDNYPTYHLANIVDDHQMGISHVIRGSEWLSSMPKHMQIVKEFDFNALKKKPIVFEMHWMKEFNKSILERTSVDDIVPMVRRLAQEKYGDSISSMVQEFDVLSDEFIRKAINLAGSRIGCAGDLFGADFEFLWSLQSDAANILSACEMKKFDENGELKQTQTIIENPADIVTELESLCRNLKSDSETSWLQDFMTDIRQLCTQNGVKFKDIMKLMRACLSSSENGPPIKEMLDAIGHAGSVFRLAHARKLLTDFRIDDVNVKVKEAS